VSAVNPLVSFYDINGGKGEMIFFYSTRVETDANRFDPSFNLLFRHPWEKGRGDILLFCPGYHTRIETDDNRLKHRKLRTSDDTMENARSLIDFLIISYLYLILSFVRSTARHIIHLQFDISAYSLKLKTVQSPKCIV
jgi:hypothetical protein